MDDFWEKKYKEKVRQEEEEEEEQVSGCIIMTICTLGIITLIILGAINASN